MRKLLRRIERRGGGSRRGGELVDPAGTSGAVDVDLGGHSNVVNTRACFANGEQAEVAGMMAAGKGMMGEV